MLFDLLSVFACVMCDDIYIYYNVLYIYIIVYMYVIHLHNNL